MLCRDSNIEKSLWEALTFLTTAAAHKASKVQKRYLDTVDEPIHEECVLGECLVQYLQNKHR